MTGIITNNSICTPLSSCLSWCYAKPLRHTTQTWRHKWCTYWSPYRCPDAVSLVGIRSTTVDC